MVVTHLFQVLAFMAMEPPTALEPRAIDEEKNKVFRTIKLIDPANVVRGQYMGYREMAARCGTGVRSRDLHRAQVRDRQLALGGGAVLPAHRGRITGGRADHLDRVQGATAQHVPARAQDGRPHRAGPPDLRSRRLRPGMSLSFYGKRPGPGMKLDKVSMQFAMQDTGWAGSALEAYERLIRNTMRGDHRCSPPPRASSGCGSCPRRCWEPAAVGRTGRGRGGRTRFHQLVAPHAWRLPFERAWRHPNAVGA